MSIVIRYEFAAATDVGRVRANNEDTAEVDAGARLVLLADGMGGYNAGEVASVMAVSSVRAELARWLAEAYAPHNPPPSADEIRRAMEKCVDEVNQAILNAAESNPQYTGMGTTLVVGVFKGPRLMLGHIGDSRCYRMRGGALEQITRDHSWLQEQVDAGLITQQQAASSTSRNLVTRALGVEELVALEINEFEVQPGDLYLICSDGLSEMVHHHELLTLLQPQEPKLSLPELSDRLIAAANANGGRDNISVALARACGPDPERGLMARLKRARHL